MAYCPKCGVEIENNVKNCPLCDFPIPDIYGMQEDTEANKFPEARNMYVKTLETLRNKIFITVFLLSIITIVTLLTIGLIRSSISDYMTGLVISVMAGLIYLFIIMGYIPHLKLATAIFGGTAILQSFLMDYVDGEMEWSLTYALPIAISGIAIFLLTVHFYKKGKHKNHFIFIPVYTAVGVSILSIIVETVLSINFDGTLKISWSLVVFISLQLFAVIMTGLYNVLPEDMREKLRRVFHV
jgi:hypothetical protein